MALSVVQAVKVAGSLVSSVTTAGITTTSGNLLHADPTCFDSQTITSVTDSKSNTWTQVGSDVHGALTLNHLQMHYAKNITGGASHTFTLTCSGNTYPVLGITEIAGADITAPLDQSGSNTDTGTTHTVSTGGATSQNDEIVCGAISTDQTTTTWTVGAGFTEQNNQASTASTTGLETATKIISTTGTQTYAPTSGSTATSNLMIATYKAAASAAASVSTLLMVGV